MAKSSLGRMDYLVGRIEAKFFLGVTREDLHRFFKAGKLNRYSLYAKDRYYKYSFYELQRLKQRDLTIGGRWIEEPHEFSLEQIALLADVNETQVLQDLRSGKLKSRHCDAVRNYIFSKADRDMVKVAMVRAIKTEEELSQIEVIALLERAYEYVVAKLEKTPWIKNLLSTPELPSTSIEDSRREKTLSTLLHNSAVH